MATRRVHPRSPDRTTELVSISTSDGKETTEAFLHGVRGRTVRRFQHLGDEPRRRPIAPRHRRFRARSAECHDRADQREPDRTSRQFTQQLSSISQDGRYVAFSSSATDLLPPFTDTNGKHDIFVRDRLAGTTQRVSPSSGGAQANGDCYHPSPSADGRIVAFQSYATNLAPMDTTVSPTSTSENGRTEPRRRPSPACATPDPTA